ncbi:hypothetical protein C8R46DRAFT_1121533 [Mycena filopes]|nr:hypothetical protein C8R46DRAFT_1121533 [Mycena filopes]
MADDPTSPTFLWGLFIRELFETSVRLYVNLFILAIYTLHRRRTSGRTWLLAASWMLFVVGTIQTILRILIITVIGGSPTPQIIGLLQDRLQLELVDNAVFAVNVCIVATLVWGYRVKPILLPALLILATTSLAIVSLVEGASSKNFLLLAGRIQIITTTTAYILGVVTNVVLMGLTAGRIWWMRRTFAKLDVTGLHSSIDTRSNAAMSIIFESGSIYCFSAFLLAIALATSGSSTALYSVLLGVAYQAINIAPTLTVVRDAVKKGFTQPPKPTGKKLVYGSNVFDLRPDMNARSFDSANSFERVQV